MDRSFYNSKLLSEYKSKMIESTGTNIDMAIFDGLSFTESDNDIKTEALIESFIELIEESGLVLDIEETQLNEGAAQTLRKIKDKVSQAVVKVTLAEKQLYERINEKFNRYIKLYREGKRNATYDSIVKRSIDLSRILKSLIRSIVVGILVPGGVQIKLVSAIIAIIIQTALDKRTDKKYKNLIFNDLKFELKIVQEKIKDAEARGDIKSKYKLMRIENQIGRAMDRIKYNIRD
mgnify:FL=1